MHQVFSNIDFIILGAYLLLVLVVSIYFSRNKGGIENNFLAGRSMGWLIIGSSLFITTVSSEHVIGYPESGYTESFAAGNFAWEASLTLIFLAWIIFPIFIKSKVFTTPEFIGRRYGEKSRLFISIFSIFIYVITKVAVTLLVGAFFLEGILGWDKYTAALALVLMTGVFTIAGGLKGVMYTQVFHCFVLITSATIVTIVGIVEVGGLEEILKIPESHFNVFESVDHENYPWTGMILGVPILEIWYWGTDHYMVQRILSAKNVPNARRGALFAGFLMLLPSIILLVPGFVAYAHFGPDAVEGVSYLSLVDQVLPNGIKALAVISLLSALISSLSASFNSTAALFTLDIYKRIYPKANDFKIVNVGRLATFTIVIFSIIWVTLLSYFSENIIKHLQSVQSYIAPPFTAIFLVGIFWTRANGKAAFTVLITGAILGFFRLSLDVFKAHIPTDSFLMDILEFNFLHEAVVLFLLYVVMMVVISLLTEKPGDKQLKGFTYKFRNTRSETEPSSNVWKKQDIISSIILVIMLLSIWLFLLF